MNINKTKSIFKINMLVNKWKKEVYIIWPLVWQSIVNYLGSAIYIGKPANLKNAWQILSVLKKCWISGSIFSKKYNTIMA